MNPFVVGGDVWEVRSVPPGSPELVDRTGAATLATTDAGTRTVYVSSDLEPPLLDRVMLHEVAHAVELSHGLLRQLHEMVPYKARVPVEEWSAQLVENHALEAVSAASTALGRPVCVMGVCDGQP